MCVLGVPEVSEAPEIPYLSLLPAGNPQSGLFSLVKVCGVGVWPQKCRWGLCCSRVDPFSGFEGLVFVFSSVIAMQDTLDCDL